MNHLNEIITNYSLKIRKWKIFLFIILFFSLGGIFVSISSKSLQHDTKLSITEIKEEISAKTTKPVFKIRDNHGNIYQISADYLLQQSTDLVFLRNIKAVLENKKQKLLTISSKEANYIQKDKKLYFNSDPEIKYENYQFIGKIISLDFQKNLIHAQKSIAIGPDFSFKADDFLLDKNKQLIKLEGHVKLNYHPAN